MVHAQTVWWRRRNNASSTSGGWKKCGLSPKTLPNFYRCTIESILSSWINAWYGNCTAHNHTALQRVVRSEQRITGGKLPALQDTYNTRCHRKAKRLDIIGHFNKWNTCHFNNVYISGITHLICIYYILYPSLSSASWPHIFYTCIFSYHSFTR
jgi:hypothetical protein